MVIEEGIVGGFFFLFYEGEENVSVIEVTRKSRVRLRCLAIHIAMQIDSETL